MPTGLTPVKAPSSTAVGQRILDSAAELFYTHGVTATGVDLIVNEAGTTKRTLYQRFGSKDALVAAYLQQRAHDWQSQLLEAVEGADPVQTVDAVYDQLLEWSGRHGRGCAFVNAWAELGPTGHEAVAVIQAEKEWMRGLFSAAAGDEEVGEVLYLLYEGAMVSSAVRQDTSPLETARTTSKRILTS
ncbi:TetR/AcrR family transcriptional regulator [Actinomycetota bacterium]